MKKQPKISILVPVYNVEKYLRQCLDSVINQTLQDIEIIIINDGSTDSSPQIIKEYMKKDKRIRLIDKKNSGYGHSMNQGLKAATGKYVGIVESDDFVEPEMFEKLYETAVKHKNIDVVKSNFWAYVTKNNSNTLTRVVPEDDANQVICPMQRQAIFWSMPCIWSAIYRRDFLTDNGISFLETPGASYQDAGFNFKVWAMAQKVYLLNDAFLHYRQDNENSSVNSPKKVYCVCDEYHEMKRFAQEKHIYERLKYLIPRLRYASYMWNFKRLAFPLNWQFLKVFSQEYADDFAHKLIDKSIFGRKEYRRLKCIAKHPYWFFIKYNFKKAKKCIHL